MNYIRLPYQAPMYESCNKEDLITQRLVRPADVFMSLWEMLKAKHSPPA